MPQKDRHKNRQVEIEFHAQEHLTDLPYNRRYSLILLTQGSFKAKLNNYPITVNFPSVICLKSGDDFEVLNQQNISASTFSFDPTFLNTVRLSQSKDLNVPNTPRIKEGLSLFENDLQHIGLIELDTEIYSKFLQWFFTLGMEVSAQSDDLWVCRIKQYLIQIFNLLKQLKDDGQNSAIDQALKYIHINYASPIRSEDLTQLTHLNRVSLNEQFKKRLNQTALQYLMSYRLNIAEQMLTHTGMSLNDIALATGFEYDTYFMKQFKQKNGISPTEYRNLSREIAVAQ
ncbi:helix-turn-helix domain-containing protein [Companilactobacillus nuruki]|uniref:AraC family transcriptional regulator n=1 Tax=Companilactobacillus nuruki TaxID=1993540 RepID=A0A2N7AVZ9_9LACO|nr:AraC family transcriptional regulator [Companilactobacillus nuruki]PMD72504.1 AraC family transcriptional regulator [Companilactobacillus nuruki]